MPHAIGEEEIFADVEKNGRLSEDQENVMYEISLRQEELGRQPTNMFLSELEKNEDYQTLIEREFLTYDLYNHGPNRDHDVANLIVTLKGLRYCIVYGDEIHARRKVNPAGVLKEKLEKNN